MDDKATYVEEFKKLYELKHDTIISDDVALEYFENLIALIRIIYQPIRNAKVKTG